MFSLKYNILNFLWGGGGPSVCLHPHPSLSFLDPHSLLHTSQLCITPHPSSLTYHFHSLIRIFGGLSEFFTCLTEIFSPIYEKSFCAIFKNIFCFSEDQTGSVLGTMEFYMTPLSQSRFLS